MAIPRIDQFLVAVTKTQDIAKLCHDEMFYLRQEYKVQENVNDKGIFAGLATYKRVLTEYRKAIFSIDNNHIALQYLKLSDDENERFRQQNTTTSFRNMNNDLWLSHEIYNSDGFILKSISLLQARSYIDNILGLAALTGRRIGEIGFYSDFQLIKQSEFDKEYSQFNMIGCDGLKVLHLSKKNQYGKPERQVNAIIPVLYNPESIITAFKDFRFRKTFDSHQSFHNAANKELSIKVKKHYSEFLGNCSCHDLRKAYARIIFDSMTNLPNEAMAIVIEKILVQSIPANYIKFSAS